MNITWITWKEKKTEEDEGEVKVVKDNARKIKEEGKGTCNDINPLRGYLQSFTRIQSEYMEFCQQKNK